MSFSCLLFYNLKNATHPLVRRTDSFIVRKVYAMSNTLRGAAYPRPARVFRAKRYGLPPLP